MIRRASPDQADAIAEIYERSYSTLTFLPKLHTLDEHRVWFGRVVAEQEVWVWEAEGSLGGFAALGETTLDYLYVEPALTGRGIGGALLAHAKERRAAGFTLWTFQANDGARRFYERHGLQAILVTDGDDNEEKQPDVLYEWRPEGRRLSRRDVAVPFAAAHTLGG